MIGFLAALGRGTARWLARVGALARFAFEAAASLTSLPGAGRRVAGRVLLNQLRFTALEAVGLIVLLSGVLSYLVISSSIAQLGRVGATELIGELMVVAIVRELGPLLTALAVVGRSGTAITAELATNTVLGEVRALEGMGIDPYHYLVLPRLLGCVVSVTCLMVLFDVVAIAGGFLGAASIAGMSLPRYLNIVTASLTTRDVTLTVLKGGLFGLVIGLLPSYQGLAVRRGPTEIPQAVIRGTVGSIAVIFIVSALIVLVL
ncbi:MAG TPA: ABC transporter permease [Gemmatimonadales bacterium]|jgi:phospholipid/cholesterol/gamma-HCH transport system permease protein|nr:ABC transporter permease [Gemmatimonadales bacterium]